MLLWRPSTSVPSMLWLQFKWQVNRYVNGLLLSSKGIRCSLCMLQDSILKPLDPQIPWLGGFLRGLSEKTTENANTGGRHVKSRWMDVVKKEVRSADVQIKDEAVLVPSFPLDLQGGHGFRVHRQTSVFRRLESPPFLFQWDSFTHPPSSSSVPAFEQSSPACASTAQGKRKEMNRVNENKAMNFTRWRRRGRKGSSNPYESLLGKLHSNNIHCELKAKSKSIFTTHSNCRTNSLNA